MGAVGGTRLSSRPTVSRTMVPYGRHNVAQQAQLALSSGEAEFCGTVRAAGISRQTSQILEQVGMNAVTVPSNSSASRCSFALPARRKHQTFGDPGAVTQKTNKESG